MRSIGFSEGNGDNRCVDCKGFTFLLVLKGIWAIDDEPIESGQEIEDIKNKILKREAEKIYKNGIELDTEITCHYCPNCEKIVSINANW
jgi:hypothetical protein